MILYQIRWITGDDRPSGLVSKITGQLQAYDLYASWLEYEESLIVVPSDTSGTAVKTEPVVFTNFAGEELWLLSSGELLYSCGWV